MKLVLVLAVIAWTVSLASGFAHSPVTVCRVELGLNALKKHNDKSRRSHFVSTLKVVGHPIWNTNSLPKNKSVRPAIGVLIELCRLENAAPVVLTILAGCGRALGMQPEALQGFSSICWANALCMAASTFLLNCGANVLNQITDIDCDAFNKPHRPIVSGRILKSDATRFCLCLFSSSLFLAWQVVGPTPALRNAGLLRRHQAFWFSLAGVFLASAYSLPALGRLKATNLGSRLAIGVNRGMLLNAVGSATCIDVLPGGATPCFEPWLIGLVFGSFLYGACVTKDFSDMEGDRASGCLTLPVMVGAPKAAKRIAPYFVAPWLLLIVMAPMLSANAALMTLCSVPALATSVTAIALLLRTTSKAQNDRDLAKSLGSNHPSWTLMYLTMALAQCGTWLAYAAPQFARAGG